MILVVSGVFNQMENYFKTDDLHDQLVRPLNIPFDNASSHYDKFRRDNPLARKLSHSHIPIEPLSGNGYFFDIPKRHSDQRIGFTAKDFVKKCNELLHQANLANITVVAYIVGHTDNESDDLDELKKEYEKIRQQQNKIILFGLWITDEHAIQDQGVPILDVGALYVNIDRNTAKHHRLEKHQQVILEVPEDGGVIEFT
jgi:hypothetical protein